jgi:hypothetical protein
MRAERRVQLEEMGERGAVRRVLVEDYQFKLKQ